MYGNSKHGNRESPRASAFETDSGPDGEAERSEKVEDRTSDVHAGGKSDGSIVPQKRTNKAGSPTGGPAAEPVEEREPTKGNVDQTATNRTPTRKRPENGVGSHFVARAWEVSGRLRAR
jgi:hypothetical protein